MRLRLVPFPGLGAHSPQVTENGGGRKPSLFLPAESQSQSKSNTGVAFRANGRNWKRQTATPPPFPT